MQKKDNYLKCTMCGCDIEEGWLCESCSKIAFKTEYGRKFGEFNKHKSTKKKDKHD